MKDTGLRIRVEEQLRREFVQVCKSQDLTAAQVLRAFMRDYAAKHRAVVQGELFPAPLIGDLHQ